MNKGRKLATALFWPMLGLVMGFIVAMLLVEGWR